jgi:hypothetical protein
MTEKCTRYANSLAQLYHHICRFRCTFFNDRVSSSFETGQSSYAQPADTTGSLQQYSLRNLPIQRTLDDGHSQELFEFPDLNDIHMGMSLDDIFITDFDTGSHAL